MSMKEIETLRARMGAFEVTAASNRMKVELAQQALLLAIALLDGVADATQDEYARAYVVDHLRALAAGDPDFQGRWFDLKRWLDRLDVARPGA
ncbi:MAG: hypothetical protein ACREJ2_04735 [Planctomycetota bacterium]